MEPDKWLTIQQLADHLGVGVEKVRARVRDKRWPHFRDGRTIRFTPEHIQAIADIGQVTPRRGRLRK